MNFVLKKAKRLIRHKRIRSELKGTAEKPRLCVFRSNSHVYAELIDDDKAKVLASANDLEVKKSKPSKTEKTKEEKNVRSGKVALAFEVGKLIAKKTLDKKIDKIVFDRGGYKYHGIVKALAEGAREGGIKF